MSVSQSLRSLSHVIPRRRNRRGDPQDRLRVGGPALVSLDVDALKTVADAYRDGHAEPDRLYVWLKAYNAVASQAHVQDVRAEIERERQEVNAFVSGQLEALGAKQAALATEEKSLTPEAVRLAACLNLAWKSPGSVLPLADSEPVGLQELAGQLNCPEPRPEATVAAKSYRWIAAVAGGLVWAVCIGLLIDVLEFSRLGRQLPQLGLFSVGGFGLLAIVGMTFVPLSMLVGGFLYRAGRHRTWVKAVTGVLWVALLVAISAALIPIEAKVEQLGLFKGLTEASSYGQVKPSQGDLLLVSLMLVVPVVAFYVVTGLKIGYHAANMCFLRGVQKERRDALRADERFGRLMDLCGALGLTREQLSSLDCKIEETEKLRQLRWTDEQRERGEDVESDTIAYSLEFESAFTGNGLKKRYPATRTGDRSVYGRIRGWLGRNR